MQKESKILITGGYGLVGNALYETLKNDGYENIARFHSKDYNLLKTDEVDALFNKEQPDYVFHCAAAVYGIGGNMNRQGWAYYANNLMNLNTVDACRKFKVKKILAMGTACVYGYPPLTLPLKEDDLWNGLPHESELGYAQAKRAMLAQLMAYKDSMNMSFAYAVSGNIFGPHDNFDILNGHVTPSLVRKFHEAKQNGGVVQVWGDGSSERDFMYSTDMAQALIQIMNHFDGVINVASGEVYTIRQLVEILAEHTGMTNHIEWDTSKPNGLDFRSHDLTRLNSIGFKPTVGFKEGLIRTYEWYAHNTKDARKQSKDVELENL